MPKEGQRCHKHAPTLCASDSGWCHQHCQHSCGIACGQSQAPFQHQLCLSYPSAFSCPDPVGLLWRTVSPVCLVVTSGLRHAHACTVVQVSAGSGAATAVVAAGAGTGVGTALAAGAGAAAAVGAGAPKMVYDAGKDASKPEDVAVQKAEVGAGCFPGIMTARGDEQISGH